LKATNTLYGQYGQGQQGGPLTPHDSRAAKYVQQLLDGTENELAQAEDTPPVSQHANLHLSQEEEEECHYQPNVGFGVELVDAKNAFQEINWYLMLWAAHIRLHHGS